MGEAKRSTKEENEVEVEPADLLAEAPINIHGDMLSSILTHLPLIHLLPPSQVSKSWNHAVSTSLLHFNPLKPWLLLHAHRTTHAYDPRSHLWIQIHHLHPSIELHPFSALRSSHSTLLYLLSPSKFSFSFDPLHLSWYHVEAPLVWRTDPLVALVGHRVVVAGGACDFEEDPLSVEIYDLETRKWEACESMPAIFKDSASSTWLSVAANMNKMYVVEKSSGVAYWLDPENKAWHGPYNMSPGRNVWCSAIGLSNKKRLILVGTIVEKERLKSVRVWEAKEEESLEEWEEMGEMPEELVKKLEGEDCSGMLTPSSISASMTGELMMYVMNSENPEEVVQCEIDGGREWRWSSVQVAAAAVNERRRERVVYTCMNVGLGDLQRAMMCEGTTFTEM